jgi:hypothetical protein
MLKYCHRWCARGMAVRTISRVKEKQKPKAPGWARNSKTKTPVEASPAGFLVK